MSMTTTTQYVIRGFEDLDTNQSRQVFLRSVGALTYNPWEARRWGNTEADLEHATETRDWLRVCNLYPDVSGWHLLPVKIGLVSTTSDVPMPNEYPTYETPGRDFSRTAGS